MSCQDHDWVETRRNPKCIGGVITVDRLFFTNDSMVMAINMLLGFFLLPKKRRSYGPLYSTL